MKKKKPVYEAKMRLKKGDEVIVLSGKDKGKRGKIQQTVPEEGKVIVEGVNMVTRHQKPRGQSSRAMVKQQLGEVQMPMGVSVAKVMLICPNCNKETRSAVIVTSEGKPARKCRKCGTTIDG
ncbi:MAG: 50S ribosomal protein L24 [Armatimonadota bacterium]|nr:50S ribosomal protein L24 [bacterium]